MQRPTVRGALSWHTSTACTGGNCVQAAAVDGGSLIALRDSKNPDTVQLYSAREWSDFLDGIGSGDFDALSAQQS
jgi:hypothetical protein